MPAVPSSPAVAVVRLHGELDTYDAPAVRRELAAALDAGSDVVVDMRECDFIDSVVGGALLESRREAHRRELEFALVLSESRANHARRMLEQTHLIEIFRVFDSPEAAAVGLRTA